MYDIHCFQKCCYWSGPYIFWSTYCLLFLIIIKLLILILVLILPLLFILLLFFYCFKVAVTGLMLMFSEFLKYLQSAIPDDGKAANFDSTTSVSLLMFILPLILILPLQITMNIIFLYCR